ncbi:MAG: STAS domain-containing protein [Pyrinomonadaceae bacterium]
MLKVQAKKLGNIEVLTIYGQIVNGETEILRNAVQSVSEASVIKLDLARVTTVDAGGLGVLLALREQAQSKGIRFELLNITRQIGRVFEITRLDTVFQITSGVEFFPGVRPRLRTPVTPRAACA